MEVKLLAQEGSWAGIIPPMVTPFKTDDETIDERAIQAEVEYLIAAGVDGLCITGSTGEGQTLTVSEAALVAKVAVEQARGRVPVISGIIQNSTKMVVEYATAVRAMRVDGLQITPVHYLFSPDTDATVAFYRAIADQVGLPILIYNVIPWASIDPAVLIRIMDEVPSVKGVKQSGGDMHKLADLLALANPANAIFTALDDLLYPSFVLGARGAIAGIVTTIPKTVIALWNAVQQGDYETAKNIHIRILKVWRAVEGPNMPARIKVAMELQKRSGGVSRSPYARVWPKERERIQEALKGLGSLEGMA